MNEIEGIARIRIHPGKREEFKALHEGAPVRIFTPYQSL